MKKLLFILLVSLTTSLVTYAQTDKQESVKVYGNCGMCKSRIQKAALAAGATTASWSSDSELLSFTFSSEKTTADKIEKAVAAVGHDTKNYRAGNDVYDNLPGCCQYERKPADAPAKN